MYLCFNGSDYERHVHMEKLRQEEIHRGMKKMQDGAKTKSVKKVS